MIGETLSPARAGRGPPSAGAGGRASIQVCAERVAADEAVEEIEGLRHDMIGRNRLELWDIDAGEQLRSQCASGVGAPARPRGERVAGVENDRAALLHEGAALAIAARGGCGFVATIGQ